MPEAQVTETMVTGGCLCAAVRYETRAAPHSVIYCHCASCRRATGQPLVAGGYFRVDQIVFTAGAAQRYRSSPYADRGFCAVCGTSLFYHSVMPELRDWMCLMLGSFDHPERHPPIGHWNVETALPYALHDDGLPRHRQADSDYHWVRDSLPGNDLG